MSLRDSILGAADHVIESVEVPEWGVTVHVRTLTGAERDRLEGEIVGDEGAVRRDNLRGRLVARAMCDADGNRLFADTDADALGRKSARALDRVFAVASRLNGLTKADVEELVGNSEGDRNDSSGSDSPSPSA